MSRGTTFEHGASLLQNIWTWATRSSSKAGSPALSGAGSAAAHTAADAAGNFSMRAMEEAMWKSANEVRSSSKRGFMARASRPEYTGGATRGANGYLDGLAEEAALKRLKADGVDVGGGKKVDWDSLSAKDRREELAAAKGQELDRIKKENGLTDNNIAGMASRIGERVEKGGILKRGGIGAGAVALKHPYLTVGGLGLGLYTLGSGISGTFNSLAKGELPDVSMGPLTSMFKTATDGLEYLGMDPTMATVLTAGASFFAVRGMINTALAYSGLNKILPGGLTNIVVSLALGALVLSTAMDAYQSAQADNDVKVADVNRDKIAPAPTMAPAI